MNKHTKGPWRVDALGHVAKTYEDKTNSYSMDIAIVADTPSSLGKPDLANARLIAAAPELLEALVNMTQYLESKEELGLIKPKNKPIYDLLMITNREAIKKAKGE